MKHGDFYIDTDGFYGAYWSCDTKSNCAVITMLGDDARIDIDRCLKNTIEQWRNE